MSYTDPTFAPGNVGFDDRGATQDTGAGDRAADVKDVAVDAGQHVAGVAKEEIRQVGTETKKQAKDLYRETQAELAEQAATQQKRVALGIRSLGDELGEMAGASETQGVASDLAQQAATRAAGIADWLEQRDPGSLLREVKNYAQRKPGTFIALAAVAGVLAGRLTRGVIEENKDSAKDATRQASASTGYTPTNPDYTGATGYAGDPDLTSTPGYTGTPNYTGTPGYTADPDLGGMPR